MGIALHQVVSEQGNDFLRRRSSRTEEEEVQFVKICKLVIFFCIVKVAAEEGEKIATA